jgi:hypothetical protein
MAERIHHDQLKPDRLHGLDGGKPVNSPNVGHLEEVTRPRRDGEKYLHGYHVSQAESNHQQ